MASCSSCGTKIGFTKSMCPDCSKKAAQAEMQETRKQLRAEFEAVLAEIKTRRPDFLKAWEAFVKDSGKREVGAHLKLMTSIGDGDWLKVVSEGPTKPEISLLDPIPASDKVLAIASGINKFGPSDTCYWILTDKHIVIVRYGLIRQNELRGSEVVALDQVTGFEKSKTSRGDIVWNLIVTRANNTDGIHNVKEGVATAMVTAFNAAKAKISSGSGSREKKDAAEAIRSLKSLLEEGLITKAEFEKKRAKLIEEI